MAFFNSPMIQFLSIVLIASLISVVVFTGSVVRHFKEIAAIQVYPYHYEGLIPSLTPQNEDHYEFMLNELGLPIRITHYNEDGQSTNSKEGWAVFKVTYDPQGRVRESACLNANNKLTTCKSLGFSREVIQYDSSEKPIQTFYSPKGRILKNLNEFLLDNKANF